MRASCARRSSIGSLWNPAILDVTVSDMSITFPNLNAERSSLYSAASQSFNSPTNTTGLRLSSAQLRLPVSTNAWRSPARMS